MLCFFLMILSAVHGFSFQSARLFLVFQFLPANPFSVVQAEPVLPARLVFLLSALFFSVDAFLLSAVGRRQVFLLRRLPDLPPVFVHVRFALFVLPASCGLVPISLCILLFQGVYGNAHRFQDLLCCRVQVRTCLIQ